MSSPDDWPYFYQQNLSNQEQQYGGEQGYGSSTTVITTTVTSSSTAIGSATSSGVHLSAEGRVGKPTRKRSRASKRTPTTLLNTDPTNFRAMVQQLTGGSTAVPFAPGSVPHPGGPNIGFGLRQPHVNPGSFTVHPAGFQFQYYQQQQQQEDRLIMQQQNQAYMFSLNNNDDVGTEEHLLRRLRGNPNPRPNMEAGSEAEGVSSQVPSSRTTSSNENTRSNTSFMF